MQSNKQQKRPYGMTIFCDDIRQEVGGKLTYVGCYDELTVEGSFPVDLPRLCLVVHYFEPASAFANKVEVEVFLPGDDTPIAKSEMNFPAASVAPIAPPDAASTFVVHGTLIFALGPLKIRSPGYLRVRGKRGTEVLALGALGILASKS